MWKHGTLFLCLHTLFFDKLPLPLDSKKTKFSPIHQTWPSPAVSSNPLQELLSQLISSKSLSQLPSLPSLWLYTLRKRQDCKPASHCPTHFHWWALSPQKISSILTIPCGGGDSAPSPSLSAAPLHGSFILSCGKAHLWAPSLHGSSWQEVGTSFMF